MGDTGTTPRNDFGGLFMNRGVNMSYADLRQENNNMGLSPYMGGGGQRGQDKRVLMPTPLRHTNSIISGVAQGRDSSTSPAFGGGNGFGAGLGSFVGNP